MISIEGCKCKGLWTYHFTRFDLAVRNADKVVHELVLLEVSVTD